MSDKKIIIAIVGSTGAVGQEIIQVLNQQQIKFYQLKLFSHQSHPVSTPWGLMTSEPFDFFQVSHCDIVFLAVNGTFSQQYALPLAQNSLVIDNSSAFRYKPEIPLVIPEINGRLISESNLISNPNCTTAIALMALYPIYQTFGLQKIIISTYQAASGAGQTGIQELENQLKEKNDQVKVFSQTLAYNVIPHIDQFQSNGYTKEEMKVVWEIQKILNDDNIKISCTAVRVPTLRCHAEAITIETQKPVDLSSIRQLYQQSPGVKLIDDICIANRFSKEAYPTPLSLTGVNEVGVGRLRLNPVFEDKGLDLFVCGDQLLRGAALNAVLIVKEYMTKI